MYIFIVCYIYSMYIYIERESAQYAERRVVKKENCNFGMLNSPNRDLV